MSKRKIEAKEAIECVRGGMDDQTLMEKFNLSAKGLQSLFRKLVTIGALTQAELDQRTQSFMGSAFVDAAEQEAEAQERGAAAPVVKGRRQGVDPRRLIRDIRSGMTDGELMEKYGVSARGLQSLFEQLTSAGLIRQIEIDQRMTSFDATVDLLEMMKELGLEERPRVADPARRLTHCPACGEAQTILFEECPFCGVNIEDYLKKQERDRQHGKPRRKCPACGRPWDKDYNECPVCGVIVSKLKA